VNWTEILLRAGIPEPPGRVDLVALLRDEQAKAPRPEGKRGKKGKRKKG